MRIFARGMMIWAAVTLLCDGTRGYCASEVGEDNFCGPRCVAYLLKIYGRESVDLIEIIRQCNWPDADRGASLLALDQLLNQNGIATRPLDISYDADLSWPHPVLVHIVGSPARNGHYVVWLGSIGAVSTVWDGRNGIVTIDNDILAENRSGHILLTAFHADTLSGNCTVLRCRSLSTIGTLYLLGDTIVIGFFILLRSAILRLSTKKIPTDASDCGQRGVSEPVEVE